MGAAIEPATQPFSPPANYFNLPQILTNHGMVLLYVAEHPDARIHEIAAQVAITERRVADIIKQLKEAGFISLSRTGRRNSYQVKGQATLQHQLVADVPVTVLLGAIRDHRRAVRPETEPNA